MPLQEVAGGYSFVVTIVHRTERRNAAAPT
jgi:hypothetical protein